MICMWWSMRSGRPDWGLSDHEKIRRKVLRVTAVLRFHDWLPRQAGLILFRGTCPDDILLGLEMTVFCSATLNLCLDIKPGVCFAKGIHLKLMARAKDMKNLYSWLMCVTRHMLFRTRAWSTWHDDSTRWSRALLLWGVPVVVHTEILVRWVMVCWSPCRIRKHYMEDIEMKQNYHSLSARWGHREVWGRSHKPRPF